MAVDSRHIIRKSGDGDLFASASARCTCGSCAACICSPFHLSIHRYQVGTALTISLWLPFCVVFKSTVCEWGDWLMGSCCGWGALSPRGLGGEGEMLERHILGCCYSDLIKAFDSMLSHIRDKSAMKG